MEFKFELVSKSHRVCGHLKWSLFKNSAEQGHRYTKFMDRIPSATKWPVAILENVYVMPRFRRHGYGRNGVEMFLEHAKSEGAVLAILKVGWDPSEDTHVARVWKTKFYQSSGFAEIATVLPEPVLMFLALR